MVARGSMSMVVRGQGLLENLEQMREIFIKSIGGTPIYLKDLATVSIDTRATNAGCLNQDRDGPRRSQDLGRLQQVWQQGSQEPVPRCSYLLLYDDAHRSGFAGSGADRFISSANI